MEGGWGEGKGEEGGYISDLSSCQDLACGQVEQKLWECPWLSWAPLISELEAGHSVSLSLQPACSPGPGRWCLSACPQWLSGEQAGQRAWSLDWPFSESFTLKIEKRPSPQQWLLGTHEKPPLGILSRGRAWCFFKKGILTSCLCPLADRSNQLRLHSFSDVIEKAWQLQNVSLGLFPTHPHYFCLFFFSSLF